MGVFPGIPLRARATDVALNEKCIECLSHV